MNNVRMSYREDGTTLAAGNPNVVQALRILKVFFYMAVIHLAY